MLKYVPYHLLMILLFKIIKKIRMKNEQIKIKIQKMIEWKVWSEKDDYVHRMNTFMFRCTVSEISGSEND